MSIYEGITILTLSSTLLGTSTDNQGLTVSSGTNVRTVIDGELLAKQKSRFRDDVTIEANVYIDKSLDVSGNLHVKDNFIIDGNIESNSLHVRKNVDIDENLNVYGNLTVSDNILYKNPNINGFLRTNEEGLVYSDLIKSDDIQDNAILNSKIINNAVTTDKIANDSVTSEKIATNIHFKGYPLVDSVNNSISKNIVNVDYVNNVKSEITGIPPTTLNTLEKISNAIDNDNIFHTKVARLSGANFTGPVTLTKMSFGSSIKKFIDISVDESILFNEVFLNFNLIGHVNTCYLPNILENGSSLCVLNNSENEVVIKSSNKIYHYIFTPLSGLNEIVIMPNMLYCFLFFGNKWSLIH